MKCKRIPVLTLLFVHHKDFITLPFHVALWGCGGGPVGALQGMGSSRVALKGPTSGLGGKFQGQVHMGEKP